MSELDARIQRLARRFARGVDDLADELAQIGRIAAWEAESTWSPGTKVPRGAWAYMNARWRIMDAVRRDLGRGRRTEPLDVDPASDCNVEGQVQAREVLKERLPRLGEPLYSVAMDMLQEVSTRVTAARLRVSTRHIRRYRQMVVLALRE